MDENEVTQVMSAAEEPPEPALIDEGPVPKARASVPRRWFAAAVVAVLLLAAGVGVYLGMQGKDEPEVAEKEVAEAEQATVPDLRGMTLERAIADAEAAGLEIGPTANAAVDPSVAPSGTVLSQDPLPGASAAPGSAITLVFAQAPVETQSPADSSAGAGSSGTAPSGGTPATPTEPPPAPENVAATDISKLAVKPKAIDLSLIQTAQWTTVVEHHDTALEWTSGPAVFGGGDKRIILNADGPNGNLVAVYSWDSATSTDWRLQSIIVSQPGDLPYQSIFSVPASTQMFMVRSNSTAVLWTLTVQEKK